MRIENLKFVKTKSTSDTERSILLNYWYFKKIKNKVVTILTYEKFNPSCTGPIFIYLVLILLPTIPPKKTD